MADKRKNALGRGLGAILSSSPEQVSEIVEAVSAINEISLDSIEVNNFQPRDYFDQEKLQELADSIKVQGIIQPITVRQLSAGKYQIISGERRFRASKLAGLTAIPAYVRKADDQQMLEMALIENIQRENLNPIEVSLSYQRLISECGLKQEELGERVGKNRSTVTNFLRLLKLPPDIQAGIRDNTISMGHAKAILSIEDVERQLALYKKLVSEQLSVRQAEELARDLSSTKDKKVDSAPSKQE
ncbi:MAG: ParB/RepB/Spo0J family partition protein, partial [Cytophagales bacterium]|nr:ParB/RepB/Spo0J family partition protein [Cytophagales bacterium]